LLRRLQAAREKEVVVRKTNGMRILILLSLALGFFLGRKAASPRISTTAE
jgi:hypothetical protein